MQKVRGSSPRRSTNDLAIPRTGDVMTIGQPAPERVGISAARLPSRAVVGRSLEIEAIEMAIDDARHSLVGISLEGEPGIGKTTLMRAAAGMAAERGLTPIQALADEEIRGPLLLARSIFSADEWAERSDERTRVALERMRQALDGDDEGSVSLSGDERLLRIFDRAAGAFRALARETPIALLLDDLQWADQDSIRLLRYVVRANPSLPMFVMITIRPEETAAVTELVTLLADLERMGILRRLRVGRFRQAETTALLKHLLGGEVSLAAAATIHAQAEGVPFIVEELVRTYREAGLLQQINGSWTLARNAERLVPSAVRTLIQRRAASLDDGSRELLATGALLGRAFRIADICAIRTKMNETSACEVGEASKLLQPALSAGLLTEAGPESGRYLTFSHEQVRAFALDSLSAARRKELHGAIVDMLTANGDPPAELLPTVVRHALAAGEADKAARYSLDAARSALAASAPEEALRLIEDALGVVSNARQRVEILLIRDEALELLGRSADRVEAIAELSALVEAVGDPELEFGVQLRRAAALRGDRQYELAAEVARRARQRARDAGSAERELLACLELGQDLLRSSLGEGYLPVQSEADLDGAREAFQCAADIAEQVGDDRPMADATRELGVIMVAQMRAWFAELVKTGQHVGLIAKLVGGMSVEELINELPIAAEAREAERLLTRSLELFEKLGDRRGAMSAIVSLAYLHWTPELHLSSNPAQRFEGIRQITATLESLVQEGERDLAEAQMLYGVHVFARSKLIPDLAITRGEEAHKRARALGDRSLEFLSAVGTACAHLDVGDADGAAEWVGRAAEAAAEAPTPTRARQLTIAQALLAGARGDGAQMRAGFENAARLAAAQRRSAARCETLALLALEAARIGAASGDEDLMTTAWEAAGEARRLAVDVPGHPPWAAQADAAAARVANARGDASEALRLARSALAQRQAAMREDPHLEILLPCAAVVLAHGEEDEKQAVMMEMRLLQAIVAQRTFDEELRVRWFKGPIGAELMELAGPYEPPTANGGTKADASSRSTLSESEGRLLRLLAAGRSNREIGDELGIDEGAVSRELAALYASIGTASRAEATAFAFRSGAV
jgi:DNA-binding CsgD family transcriptional regulator